MTYYLIRDLPIIARKQTYKGIRNGKGKLEKKS